MRATVRQFINGTLYDVGIDIAADVDGNCESPCKHRGELSSRVEGVFCCNCGIKVAPPVVLDSLQ